MRLIWRRGRRRLCSLWLRCWEGLLGGCVLELGWLERVKVHEEFWHGGDDDDTGISGGLWESLGGCVCGNDIERREMFNLSVLREENSFIEDL